MKMKRTRNALALAVLLATLTASMARAASEPRILQWKSAPDGDSLTVYVRHDDSAAVRGISVDGTAVTDADIAPDAGATELVTWILCDRSTFVPEELLGAAAEVLDALVGLKARGETYRFCVFSDSLREVGDLTKLKRQLSASQYDKPSNIAGALEEVLKREEARNGAEFARIVIISAGGDLQSLSPETMAYNVPIYAIGCDNGSNAAALSALRDLSGRTFARYWDISEVSAWDIANIMRWEEIPVRVTLSVPDDWSAGTPYELKVGFSDGASVRETVVLPSADETAAQTVEDALSASETAQGRFSARVRVVIFLTAALFALIAGAAFVLLRRYAKPSPADSPAFYSVPDATTSTAAVQDAQPSTAAVPDAETSDGDAPDDAFPMLYLSDINRPERRFRASLRRKVTVGRAPDNAISLDYDTTVSRHHCKIYRQDHALWVQDTGSSIGTYVGNARVKDAAKLPDGVPLRLGYALYKAEVRTRRDEE